MKFAVAGRAALQQELVAGKEVKCVRGRERVPGPGAAARASGRLTTMEVQVLD